MVSALREQLHSCEIINLCFQVEETLVGSVYLCFVYLGNKHLHLLVLFSLHFCDTN